MRISPRTRRGARVAAAALTAVIALAVSGCAGSEGPAGGKKIALLLPEAKTARYETFDRPLFEKRLAQLGSYDVLYSNADQDASAQQQEAESALAAGAEVLVLDPVDSKAAASIVAAAHAQDVPVISYDRLISGGGIAYYVSFDNEKVGELQATALIAGMTEKGRKDGGILMVNGSPTDSNAALFRAGAHKVLDAAGVRILAEYDTPDWSPDKAQEWVAGQIAQFGDRIAGVYAANDGVASGAVAAFKAADISPLPVVTGQDAELAAIQRIVAGEQYMTVYKTIKPEAYLAAEVAVKLIEKQPITAPMKTDGIPTTLLQPMAVTVHNIESTIVADGFWTAKQICTPAYAAACTAAGIR
jgi:D-xylose transport system substrate-binding protein